MKYCENCGKELINGVCPSCNGGNVGNNNTIPSQKKTNICAIVGFVLSFFISIAGLIVSIIGLKKSKELENGKGLSIAGIIISIVILVFQILVILIVMSGLFFAASAYPEIKKDLDDAVEDRVYDWDTVDDFDNDDALVGEFDTKTDENGNTYYTINLTKYKKDDEVVFKLNDDYEVKIDIDDIEEYNYLFYDFDMYVNNNKINVPSGFSPSEESLKFYLVDNKMIAVIYDSLQYSIGDILKVSLDGQVKKINNNTKDDFVSKDFRIENNKLSIVNSRFTNDAFALKFQDNYINDPCTYEDKSIIVEYTEEYDLSSDILEPVKTNEKTLEQYIIEYNSCG